MNANSNAADPAETATVTCRTCSYVGQAAEFCKGTNWSWCKACQRAYAAKWYQENREARRLAAAKWRQENPEAKRLAAAKWRQENPEAARLANAKWHRENPEAARLANAKWHAIPENREARRLAAAKWYQENPEASKAIRKKTKQKRRAAKAGSSGTYTRAEMLERAKLWDNKCAYRDINPRCTGEWEHDDHIMPLIPRKGEPQGTNTADNMAPACAACNLSKGNKSLEGWMKYLAESKATIEAGRAAFPNEPFYQNAVLLLKPKDGAK